MVLWNGVIVEESEFRGQESLLAECGIKIVSPPQQVDFLAALEETCEATYEMKTELTDPPRSFNCISFMAWFLRHLGVVVSPRLEVAGCGEQIGASDLLPCDLIFTHGVKAWYDDPDHGPIGHVGIATEAGVMHATRRNGGEVQGIVEESLEGFLEHTGPLRTIRRLAARSPLMTLACSAEAWLRDPPQNAEEVKKYIEKTCAWFDAQLVDA